MSKKMVYLSGPMERVSADEMNVWRQKAIKSLEAAGFGCYDPTHRVGIDHRKIVEEDLYEIERSDIILAYVPLGKPEPVQMIGTSMEIFYANRILHRPVIVWGHAMKDVHPWVFQMARSIYVDLDQALEEIIKTWG